MAESKWPWFERKFNFDFPLEKLRDIMERLRGTSLRLAPIAELSGSIRTRRIQDTWSIQENVGHLLELESLWLGRVEDILDGNAELREADLTNQATFDANYNETDFARLREMFAEARERLLERLGEIPAGMATQTAAHPRLKVPMRIVDVAYFAAEHDDYHLARIMEIRRLISDD